MKTNIRSWGRFMPLAVLALSLALFVAVVPSKPPVAVSSNVDDLFGPAGSVDGDGAVAGTDGEAVAGSDAATAAAEGGATAASGGSATQAGGATRSGGPAVAGSAAVRAGTAGDCSRNKLLEGVVCRPSAFTGDNGGATYRGVTADKITIAVYQVKQNEQVQAILNAGGGATNEDRKAALDAMEKWFNANFETYGRKVDLVFQMGTGAGADAAAQQADAVTTAESVGAFASVAVSSAGEPYYAELHRRGIPSFTLQQWSPKLFSDLAPHMFGVLPDRDLTLGHTAEYLCKRVLGRNAAHAGDPVYRTQKRKLGIIYRQEFEDDGPFFKAAVERCGGTVGKMIAYPADISQAVQIATNTVNQMKSEGITSVTCICDPIAPVYFTQQATNQGWFPEWIHNGYFLTDHPSFGRLYDQSQWRNSFGTSVLGFPELAAQNPSFAVCKAGGGPHEACLNAAQSYMTPLRTLFTALELAGPRVTDRTFAQAVYTQPPIGGNDRPRSSWGNNGPSPFTFVDDVMEIWWSAERPGPDGKPGTPFYVGAGKRYLLGQWPSTDAVVFRDDGSRQPPRDPDR